MHRDSHPHLLFAALLWIMAGSANAQDPQFSQFYNAPIYTNPAMVSTGLCKKGSASRINVNSRNQWTATGQNLWTSALAIDLSYPKIYGGVGLVIHRDEAGLGTLTTNALSAIYACEVPLNKSKDIYMHFGIEGQILQKKLGTNRLQYSDQFDNTGQLINPQSNEFERYINTSITNFNFNSGFLFNTRDFYIGLAAHNLITPNQSFYYSKGFELPMRFTLHSSVILPLDPHGTSGKHTGKTKTMALNALVMKQAKYTQANLGVVYKQPTVKISPQVFGGLFFRQSLGPYGNSDALIVTLGIRKSQWTLGYSLDYTVDKKATYAQNTHEISFAHRWCGKGLKTGAGDQLNCFDFL